MKHMKGSIRASTVVLMVVIAMLVGALAVTRTTHRVRGVQVARAAAIEQSGFSSFSPVVKRAMPAVVNISSSKVVRQQQMPRGMFDDPFFRQFFGDRMPQMQQPRSQRETSLRSARNVPPLHILFIQKPNIPTKPPARHTHPPPHPATPL